MEVIQELIKSSSDSQRIQLNTFANVNVINKDKLNNWLQFQDIIKKDDTYILQKAICKPLNKTVIVKISAEIESLYYEYCNGKIINSLSSTNFGETYGFFCIERTVNQAFCLSQGYLKTLPKFFGCLILEDVYVNNYFTLQEIKNNLISSDMYQIMIQIISALQLAHQEIKFTHYDFNPNNIIISPNPLTVKINNYWLSHTEHKTIDRLKDGLKIGWGLNLSMEKGLFPTVFDPTFDMATLCSHFDNSYEQFSDCHSLCLIFAGIRLNSHHNDYAEDVSWPVISGDCDQYDFIYVNNDNIDISLEQFKLKSNLNCEPSDRKVGCKPLGPTPELFVDKISTSDFRVDRESVGNSNEEEYICQLGFNGLEPEPDREVEDDYVDHKSLETRNRAIELVILATQLKNYIIHQRINIIARHRDKSLLDILQSIIPRC